MHPTFLFHLQILCAQSSFRFRHFVSTFIFEDIQSIFEEIVNFFVVFGRCDQRFSSFFILNFASGLQRQKTLSSNKNTIAYSLFSLLLIFFSKKMSHLRFYFFVHCGLKLRSPHYLSKKGNIFIPSLSLSLCYFFPIYMFNTYIYV